MSAWKVRLLFGCSMCARTASRISLNSCSMAERVSRASERRDQPMYPARVNRSMQVRTVSNRSSPMGVSCVEWSVAVHLPRRYERSASRCSAVRAGLPSRQVLDGLTQRGLSQRGGVESGRFHERVDPQAQVGLGLLQHPYE